MNVIKDSRFMYAPPQPILPPPRRKPRNRWLPYAFVGIMVTVGAAMALLAVGAVLIFGLSQNRVPQGVSVAGTNLSGKSLDEASSALTQALSNPTITLTDGSRQWVILLSDLGITVDVPATIKALENAQRDTAVKPVYGVDLNQAQAGLVNLSDQVNIPAAPGAGGRSMDIPVILDRLRVDAVGEVSDGVLDLNMFDVPPPAPEPTEVAYSGPTTTHVVEHGQELGLIAKMYNVSMNDIVKMNDLSDPNFIYPGEKLTIPAAGIYEPTAAEAPPAPTNSGKSILVSLYKQRIYAYESGQLVRSDLVSTGLPGSPTVLGDYKIKVKYTADDMTGPGYFLPQVPYVMYFFEGYAIHGTYWHNAFGRPMSHGCVNLPVGEAKWFFDWAQVGTPVRVIA
jgi:lipoprotein-anchoring transpeptidase ErfK/SrfK